MKNLEIVGDVPVEEFVKQQGPVIEDGGSDPGDQGASGSEGQAQKSSDQGKGSEQPAGAETASSGGSEQRQGADQEPVRKAETASAPADWKELIKGIPSEEVMSVLGLDETDMEFINHRKNGGDPYVFLEAKNRDWGKMSDIDVLRHDLKMQYPDLAKSDPDSFEIFVEKRLNKMFQVGEQFADERDKKASELEIKLEADKLRKKYADEDQRLILREKAKPTAEQDDAVAREKAQAEEWAAFVDDEDATKKLLTDKKMQFGSGDDSFTMEVDPESILKYIRTPGQFFKAFEVDINDSTGKKIGVTLSLDKMYKAVAFALNQEAAIKAAIDKGKSQGVEAEKEDLHNIPKNGGHTASGDPKESLNDAFRNRGAERQL